MNTTEVGRRLHLALHETDTVPVDVAGGWQELARRRAHERRPVRRAVLVAVAACVLAAGLAAAAVVERVWDRGPDVVPTKKLTFSPSGLPVGVLQWSIPTTKRGWTYDESDHTDDVSLTILADGRGRYQRESTAEPEPFEVTVTRIGPGRAVISHDSPVCTHQDVLTLDFAVRGHSVEVLRATTKGDCMVPVEDAAGLTGQTVRIRPLP